MNWKEKNVKPMTQRLSNNTRLENKQMTDAIINRNPAILGGTPVFTGTRVPVRILMEHLESGYDLNYFLDHFPSVSREQAVQLIELATEKLTADTEREVTA